MSGAAGLAASIRRPARLVLALLLVTFFFLFPLSRPEDPDVWFHLSAGRHLWQQGDVPSMDTFLYSYPADGPRYRHEWLFQALLYPLYRAGGMESLVLAKSVLIAGSFLLLFFTSLRGVRFYSAAAFLLAAYAAGSGRFYIRPEVAGGFIFSLQWILISRRLTGRTAAGLLLLQILWTNMHWSSILGVALAGAFAAAGTVKRFLRLPPGWRALPEGSTWQRQWLLCAGFFLATLANPDGLQPFIEPFRYLDTSGFILPVAEVWPMHWAFYRNGGLTFHHWFFASVAIVVLLLLRSIRRLNLTHLFIFAGLTLLSLAAERHVLFFALAAVPVAMDTLAAPESGRPARPALEIAGTVALLALLSTLTLNRITGVSFLLPYPRPYEPLSLSVSPVLWPTDGARLIIEKDLPDAIFNDFNSGNFLNWAIYPRKVFINGTFSDLPTVEKYARVTSAPEQWEAFAEERGIHTAFFRLSPVITHSELLSSILTGDRWRLVFYDGVGAVFLRETPRTSRLAREMSVDLSAELDRAIQGLSLGGGSPQEGGVPLLGEIAAYREKKDLSRLFRLRGRFYLLAGRADLADRTVEMLKALEY